MEFSRCVPGLYPEKGWILPLGIPGRDHIGGDALPAELLADLLGFPQGQVTAYSQWLGPEKSGPALILGKKPANRHMRMVGEISQDGIAESFPRRAGIRLDPGIGGAAVWTPHRGGTPDGEDPAAGTLGTSTLHGIISFRKIKQ